MCTNVGLIPIRLHVQYCYSAIQRLTCHQKHIHTPCAPANDSMELHVGRQPLLSSPPASGLLQLPHVTSTASPSHPISSPPAPPRRAETDRPMRNETNASILDAAREAASACEGGGVVRSPNPPGGKCFNGFLHGFPWSSGLFCRCLERPRSALCLGHWMLRWIMTHLVGCPVYHDTLNDTLNAIQNDNEPTSIYYVYMFFIALQVKDLILLETVIQNQYINT